MFALCVSSFIFNINDQNIGTPTRADNDFSHNNLDSRKATMADNGNERMKRDIGTPTEGRYIGDAPIHCAPTGVPVHVFITIIGGVLDKSAPTADRIGLFMYIIGQF
jgi:hypothetical protein